MEASTQSPAPLPPPPDQLQELRKVSLASILCENLDGVYMVQPDVFIGLDPFLNAPVTCDVFQRIDEKNIEPWKTDSPALQVATVCLDHAHTLQ